MAIAKVILNNTVQMDTTQVTVTASDLASGITALGADGQLITGTASGGGVDINDILSGTAPSGEVVLTGTSINLPFQKNTAITKITAPNLLTVPSNFIKSMSNLEYVVLPSCTKIETGGIYYNQGKLLGIDWLGGTGSSAVTSLCFAFNTKLTTMVIRQTSGILPASQSNMFNGNTIATTKPLHIYVPNSLKSTYEAATNWVTWVNDGKVVFHAIEGSTYETHYVDGTDIPTS